MRNRILSILLTLTMIVSMTPLMAYADEPADTPIEPTAATEPAPTSGGEGNSEENLYTVTFDANDGSGEMEAETVESGEYTLPECKFAAPQGKKFYKWQIGDKKYAAGEKANLDSSTVTATARR